jgi:hypothetical protein
VAGPEGAEKAKAVAEAYAKVSAERNALVTAPDVASLQGACAPVADWLRAHTGRTVPSSYKFVTVFSTDGTQGEPWPGTLYIRTPGVRGQPTTVEVSYLRDSNTVNINCTNLGEFEVFMNDDLLDLDKEVGIFVNGVPVKKDTFERRAENMFKIADDLREYGRFFPCSHVATVPAPQPTPANDAPKGGDKPADKPADEKK